MENYKRRLGSLADKLKNEKPVTPIQEVSPVAPLQAVRVEEARFNNWIPRSLKRKVKSYGADHDISQKDITIAALKEYLVARGLKDID